MSKTFDLFPSDTKGAWLSAPNKAGWWIRKDLTSNEEATHLLVANGTELADDLVLETELSSLKLDPVKQAHVDQTLEDILPGVWLYLQAAQSV